jgi:hypothetical protein
MSSFKLQSERENFAFLHYLIGLFPSIDFDGIKRLLDSVFGPGNWDVRRIQPILSLLVSTNFIKQLETRPDFFYVADFTDRLFAIDGCDADEIRLTTREIYDKHFKDLLPPV